MTVKLHCSSGEFWPGLLPQGEPPQLGRLSPPPVERRAGRIKDLERVSAQSQRLEPDIPSSVTIDQIQSRLFIDVLRDSSDCSSLPPQERAECYHYYAERAEKWAAEAVTPELCSNYLALATQWRELARETAAEAKRLTIVLDDPELASLLRGVSST